MLRQLMIAVDKTGVAVATAVAVPPETSSMLDPDTAFRRLVAYLEQRCRRLLAQR